MTVSTSCASAHPADAEFLASRILGRKDLGGGLVLVEIETPAGAATSYSSPGQYIKIRIQGESAYYVLANEPGADRWNLILRAGGRVSNLLLTAPLRTTLGATRPIGNGFPMAEARGRSLVVALGGTGIAVGRPVIRRRIAEGDASRTLVLVGIRSYADLAMHEDLIGWSQAGTHVVVCLSHVETASAEVREFAVERGYVHEILRSKEASIAGGTLFAAGPEPMVTALRASAPEVGIALSDLHTNH
jgi:NAD(P)H-flavin reductase